MPLASFVIPVVLIVIVLLILVKNIRVVPQARAFIIERLGAYSTTWNVGLHLKSPSSSASPRSSR